MKTPEIHARELFKLVNDIPPSAEQMHHPPFWKGWQKLGKFVHSLETKWTEVKSNQYFDCTPHEKNQIKAIITIVCEEYKIAECLLLSRLRTDNIALPRQVVMVLCREVLQFTTIKIGKVLKRDRGTVLYAGKSIQERIETYPAFKDRFERCKALAIKKCNPL